MIRNAETGDWIGTFDGHRGAVAKVRVNRNVTRMASAAAVGIVTICMEMERSGRKEGDACGGMEIVELKHEQMVKACDFSGDEMVLATGGYDKMVRLFDLNRYDAEPKVVDVGITKRITHTLFLPTQPNLLMVAGEESMIRVIDIRSQKQVECVNTAGPVLSLQYSSANIFSYAAGNEVCFVNDNLTAIARHEFQKIPSCVSLSLNGSFAVSFKGDTEIYKYNKAGKEVEVLRGHHGFIGWISHAPDGRIASSADDGSIRIWGDVAVAQDMEPLNI